MKILSKTSCYKSKIFLEKKALRAQWFYHFLQKSEQLALQHARLIILDCLVINDAEKKVYAASAELKSAKGTEITKSHIHIMETQSISTEEIF